MILIVDDEERVLFVLRNALTRLDSDFGVVTAGTGEDGLRKVRDVPFDLVITDLIMPDMDGVEFTEKIRDLSSEAAVVWMTAYGCRSFHSEAERLGVYRCIEKPLEIQEFREVARQAMATHREDARGPAGDGSAATGGGR